MEKASGEKASESDLSRIRTMLARLSAKLQEEWQASDGYQSWLKENAKFPNWTQVDPAFRFCVHERDQREAGEAGEKCRLRPFSLFSSAFIIDVERGYGGFFTRFTFDKDGNLIDIGAWE